MSRQQTFSTTIHLRDYIDAIADDPTREASPNYIQIKADVNVPEEAGFYSSSITTEPIRTYIYAYLKQEERDSYVSDAFIYAAGRFSTALSADGELEINVQAFSLMRYVGLD
jgi:hypothetical protein